MVSAQSLSDGELSKAQYAQFVGLQAALDQLRATLQRWEPLTTQLSLGATTTPVLPAVPGQHATSLEDATPTTEDDSRCRRNPRVI
jgi:hypothetical protein